MVDGLTRSLVPCGSLVSQPVRLGHVVGGLTKVSSTVWVIGVTLRNGIIYGNRYVIRRGRGWKVSDSVLVITSASISVHGCSWTS